MAVDYTDRKEEVMFPHNALRLAGLNVDYETTELILKTLEKVKELGGDYSLRDGAKVTAEHEAKWNEYYEQKNKQEK
jgi:hypothetical protein